MSECDMLTSFLNQGIQGPQRFRNSIKLDSESHGQRGQTQGGAGETEPLKEPGWGPEGVFGATRLQPWAFGEGDSVSDRAMALQSASPGSLRPLPCSRTSRSLGEGPPASQVAME